MKQEELKESLSSSRDDWREAQRSTLQFVSERLGDPDKVTSRDAEWTIGTGTLWVVLGERPCSVFLYDKDDLGAFRFRVQIDHCEGVPTNKLTLRMLVGAALELREVK